MPGPEGTSVSPVASPNPMPPAIPGSSSSQEARRVLMLCREVFDSELDAPGCRTELGRAGLNLEPSLGSDEASVVSSLEPPP